MTNRLRILSWNVLADTYATSRLFPLTDTKLLQPGARNDAILHMAISFGADVIALQEVEPALAELFVRRLPSWDIRWCPKNYGTPDGCLTAVRQPYSITQETRLIYTDGRVGHLVTVGGLVIANTHLKWRPPGTTPDEHTGVAEARQLVNALSGPLPTVIAGDTNDPPNGPVRQIFTAAGFTEVQAAGPTNIVRGTELAELDIIAVRGLRGTPATTGLTATPPLPGPLCPSDHLPIVADLTLAN